MMDLQDKINRYKEYLKQDPTNVSLLLQLYALHLELGQHKDALYYLDMASLHGKAAFDSEYGQFYLLNGQYQQAISALKRALTTEFDPNDVLRLANAYYEVEQFDEALNLLERHKEAQQHAEGLLLKAKILRLKDDAVGALNLLNTLPASFAPDEIESLMAMLYLENLQLDKAQDVAHKALARNPNLIDAQRVLTLIKIKEQKATPEEIKSLLQIYNDDPYLTYALALASLSSGQYDEAIGAFSKLIEVYPTDANSRGYLAYSYLFNGQIDAAEEIINTNANHPLLNEARIICLILRGDMDKAKILYQQLDLEQDNPFRSLTVLLIHQNELPDDLASIFIKQYPAAFELMKKMNKTPIQPAPMAQEKPLEDEKEAAP